MQKTLNFQSLSISWKRLFDGFVLTKKVEGCRERTIKDYDYHINRFFKEFPKALDDSYTLQTSINDYFSKECAPGTFNIRRENLKTFFSFLVKENIIQKNPITFQKRKDESKAYQISEEVLKNLLFLPNKNTFTGLRDYCLLLLTLDTGIRPQEALRLLPFDINLSGLEITIRKEVAKTNVTRTLPISPISAINLQKLLKARPDNWINEIPIFCSYTGQCMIENSWSHRLKLYSKKLSYSITPYSLRHCFALYYLRNGGNVFTLQRTMGHTDLTMTKRYLALTNEDLTREHKNASPINLLVNKRIKRI